MKRTKRNGKRSYEDKINRILNTTKNGTRRKKKKARRKIEWKRSRERRTRGRKKKEKKEVDAKGRHFVPWKKFPTVPSFGK